ncbi:MAG: TlpA family protein disulfide reductase [Acidobacteria bacterium]|nr:TlpA family protein disulfide reductase [Acidobacteriota bacterium]
MRLFVLAALAAFSLAAADVPRPAPDFQVLLSNGKEIKLSDYKGKVVVVEFLLTTCPHCQRASQGMNKVYRELGPKGMQPIGIAVNDMANMLVDDYVKQFSLDFPVGWSTRDKVINFLQHPVMMMMSFPNLVVIDRNGQIRHQIPGGDPFFENEEKNLRDLVLPLLKPAAAGTAPAKKATKKAS